MGPVWGEVLILSGFYIKILKWLPLKKYIRTPPAASKFKWQQAAPDLRPDSEY
jgi:hypothetical protein